MKTELNYFVKCIASTHCGLREGRANIISLLFAFVAAVWDHMLLFSCHLFHRVHMPTIVLLNTASPSVGEDIISLSCETRPII